MRTITANSTGTKFIEDLNYNFAETSGGGSISVLSSSMYGAVGDGVTDDTEALEELFADAYTEKKAICIEQGTYLIRRSLTLRSGMEIYGVGATLKKKAAVTTTLSSATTSGQTYIDVTSASGFAVGDQFFIADHRNDGVFPAANYCTYGVVTAINGNRISFKSCLNDAKVGCVKAHESGLQVSTSFALLRSWAPLYACDGVYIHDLTLDGNKQNSEAHEWSNSCIHIDSCHAFTGPYTMSATGIYYGTTQRNLVCKNVVIKNSPYDAISDQGAGGTIIDGCRMIDCYANGVHFGTEYDKGIVVNCIMSNCGAAGVFWCEEVNRIIVANNEIEGCNKGVSDVEYASPVKHSVVTNNIFKDITSVVFDFSNAEVNSKSGYGHVVIADNLIMDANGAIAKLAKLNFVTFTSNLVCEWAGSAPTYVIYADNINTAVIANNICPTATNYVDKDNVTNLKEANNSWN